MGINKKSSSNKHDKSDSKSVDLKNRLDLCQETLNCVQSNLNFFKACIARIITSLTETKSVLIVLEDLCRTKVNGSFYESELKIFEILINSELLKIDDIHKSTKYRGISLLNTKARKSFSKEKLLIDPYSTRKFELDFSLFNIDIFSPVDLSPGLNLGAKFCLSDLSINSKKNTLFVNNYQRENSFLNDFVTYRFNVDRMLDRALSISSVLDSKQVILDILKKSLLKEDNPLKDLKKINFARVKKHVKADFQRIAEYF
jgi:hypothetical protein